MRTAFAAAVLFGAAALAHAQPPKDPPPEPVPAAKDGSRYGVKVRVKQYPQPTPKQALRSVLEAVEAADYTYLVGQLLDPKFVDDAVAERAKLLQADAEAELAQLRDYQRANPSRVAVEDRVPLDPVGFRARAAVKARDRGFRQLLRDVQQKLTDDPQAVKDIRRVVLDGSFADADPAATGTHPEVKGRTLYFKKVGDRWYLENRQADEPKKDP